MSAKTFQQLYTDALTQADELSGSGSSVAKTIIKAGINESYAVASGARNWKTLENTGTISTVNQVNEYTPVVSSTSVPRIRRIESIIDQTDNKYLSEVRREVFERTYPFIDVTNVNNQGTPLYWYQSGYTTGSGIVTGRDVKIKIYRVPTTVLTLGLTWYEEPLELSADTDVPRLPDQFHYGLTYWALAKYFEFQKDFISLVYRNLHNEWMQTLLDEEYGFSDAMPEMQAYQKEQTFIQGKVGRIYN